MVVVVVGAATGCSAPAASPTVPASSLPLGNTAPAPIGVTDTDVRPPLATDLPRYLDAIAGDGPLLAIIATSLGTIHCELAADRAPMTVANFIGLATGQKAWKDPRDGQTRIATPFYDGLSFHRVIAGFMIQAGDPLGIGTGGPGYQFDNEVDPGLHHDRPGILAMANAGPDTNGSQFYILDAAQPHLDGGYTVFGACSDPAVVSAIAGVPATAGGKPLERVTMLHVTITR